MRKLGLAADSVVGATLLTANGTVLEADEASYPDLFWAIRGGGANYAVVLEWRLQLYRQPKVMIDRCYRLLDYSCHRLTATGPTLV